ncbi:MAG: hypothetical protein WBD46_15885 [Acidobacteriaceae bacterium]
MSPALLRQETDVRLAAFTPSAADPEHHPAPWLRLKPQDSNLFAPQKAPLRIAKMD